ncbi:hypothetical protein AB6A40_007331 [Gnathostoma spinigerum]|uniref:Uncharacterized protein n=1 Tax=Gnathostoma spinigerum TaxID=75299 RepID=A0ABD6EN36_9BILA
MKYYKESDMKTPKSLYSDPLSPLESTSESGKSNREAVRQYVCCVHGRKCRIGARESLKMNKEEMASKSLRKYKRQSKSFGREPDRRSRMKRHHRAVASEVRSEQQSKNTYREKEQNYPAQT